MTEEPFHAFAFDGVLGLGSMCSVKGWRNDSEKVSNDAIFDIDFKNIWDWHHFCFACESHLTKTHEQSLKSDDCVHWSLWPNWVRQYMRITPWNTAERQRGRNLSTECRRAEFRENGKYDGIWCNDMQATQWLKAIVNFNIHLAFTQRFASSWHRHAETAEQSRSLWFFCTLFLDLSGHGKFNGKSWFASPRTALPHFISSSFNPTSQQITIHNDTKWVGHAGQCDL